MTVRSASLILLSLLLLAGCAHRASDFAWTGNGRTWPDPPEEARVEFVTEFALPSDLGIRPSIWGQFVGAAAGGESQGMVRPMAIAASTNNRVVYVADPDAGCVHRYDLERGRYDCLIDAAQRRLDSPVALAVSANGTLYVADSGRDQVLIARPGENALAPLDLVPAPERPTGIAVHPDGGLFVVNTSAHTIRRYDNDGRLVREYGERGAAQGQLNYPTYLWFAGNDELLVTDTMNFRIQRLHADSGFVSTFGEAGDTSGSLGRPKGVATDRFGHIYIVDGQHNAIHIFDEQGRLLLDVGEQGQGDGQFWLPTGLFVTADNLIFVADSYNRRVQVFRYIGGAS